MLTHTDSACSNLLVSPRPTTLLFCHFLRYTQNLAAMSYERLVGTLTSVKINLSCPGRPSGLCSAILWHTRIVDSLVFEKQPSSNVPCQKSNSAAMLCRHLNTSTSTTLPHILYPWRDLVAWSIGVVHDACEARLELRRSMLCLLVHVGQGFFFIIFYQNFSRVVEVPAPPPVSVWLSDDLCSAGFNAGSTDTPTNTHFIPEFMPVLSQVGHRA